MITYYKFPAESASQKIVKIGKNLTKLCTIVRMGVFFNSQCMSVFIAISEIFSVKE